MTPPVARWLRRTASMRLRPYPCVPSRATRKCDMTDRKIEQFDTCSKKVRGMARKSLDLVEANGRYR
jgi:hypothetical protein